MRALVIGNDSALALNIVQALGAAGAEADVMSDWYMPRLRFSRYCRDYVRVSPESLDFAAPGGGAARFIASYCETYGIDVVIPADLRTTIGLAHLRESVLPRFPVASPHILTSLHDKWAFHQLLTEHGLPSPGTELLDVAAPETLTLSYPIIVKPALGEGGEGIHTCQTPEALAQLCASGTLCGRYLAQQLIVGHDVEISVLAQHGRVVAHTIQHGETDAEQRLARDEQMLVLAARIVQATKFHGLAHFDMRVDARDGSLYVLECNPRVWENLMNSVWAGVNFIELGSRIARGERLTEHTSPSERAAPRRMLKAVLRGRRASASSWTQTHRDPWTQLVGGLAERTESYMRERLTRRRSSLRVVRL